MGISTDAILFYGILIDDESELHEKILEFEEGPDEKSFAKSKRENPLGHMAFQGNKLDGCDLVQHCSKECPMYAIAVEGTETRAWRGHPKHLMSGALATVPEWGTTLKSFCEKYGVPWSEPGWWLVSDWS